MLPSGKLLRFNTISGGTDGLVVSKNQKSFVSQTLRCKKGLQKIESTYKPDYLQSELAAFHEKDDNEKFDAVLAIRGMIPNVCELKYLFGETNVHPCCKNDVDSDVERLNIWYSKYLKQQKVRKGGRP